MSENPVQSLSAALGSGFASLSSTDQRSFIDNTLQLLQGYHPLNVAEKSYASQCVVLSHLQQLVDLLARLSS
jgi:hypothetical protein